MPSRGVYTGSDVGRGCQSSGRADRNPRRISVRAASTLHFRRRATPPTIRRLPRVEIPLLSAQDTLPCFPFCVAHFHQGRVRSCFTVGCGHGVVSKSLSVHRSETLAVECCWCSCFSPTRSQRHISLMGSLPHSEVSVDVHFDECTRLCVGVALSAHWLNE